MIDFKKIQDKLGIYKNNRKYYLSTLGRTPYSDWHFLLLYLFLTLIFASLFALNLHTTTEQDMNDVVEFNSKRGSLNEQQVEQLQAKYGDRSALLNRLR